MVGKGRARGSSHLLDAHSKGPALGRGLPEGERLGGDRAAESRSPAGGGGADLGVLCTNTGLAAGGTSEQIRSKESCVGELRLAAVFWM